MTYTWCIGKKYCYSICIGIEGDDYMYMYSILPLFVRAAIKAEMWVRDGINGIAPISLILHDVSEKSVCGGVLLQLWCLHAWVNWFTIT